MKTTPRLLAIALLLVTASTAVAQRPDKPKYLTVSEILKLVTDSKTHYNIRMAAAGEEGLDDPMSVMFPMGKEHTFYPVISVGENGERVINQFRFDPAAFKLVEEAEPFFQSEDYLRARELCQQAVEKSPNCYLAYAHLGDSWLFMDDPETALPYYDSAIAINPFDYQPYFYKANALLRAGRFDEARDAYIEVLSLNPRHVRTYEYLRRFTDELGITFNEELFNPKALAVQRGDEIDIIVEQENGGAVWMAYGMAKGMWLGEPAHRKELTGSADRIAFSTVEETECIAALLSVYANAVDEEKVEHDAQLDRLLEMTKDGYMSQFLIYEFGSRVYPDIVLIQPEEVRESMREFIARYVVVRKG